MAAPIMAIARLLAGRRGQEKVHGFFRKLYKGGKKVRVGATDYAFGTKKFKYLPDVKPGGKYQKALLGTGQKLTTAGKHLKKHRRAYGWGATGAAIWDFLPGKDND